MQVRTPDDARRYVELTHCTHNPVDLATGRSARIDPMPAADVYCASCFSTPRSQLAYLLACGAPVADDAQAAASLTAYVRCLVGDFAGLGFTVGDAFALASDEADRVALLKLCTDLVSRILAVPGHFAGQLGDLRASMAHLDAAAIFDIPGAFLHAARATDEPGFVAFHESPAKLVADRQTRTKLGRYLARYHGGLTPAYRQAVAESYARRNGADIRAEALHYADTRDGIRALYARHRNPGPLASCMTHDVSSFKTDGVHPCEAYASGDFAAAYLTKTGAPDADLVARAIVHRPSATYVRIYPGSSPATDAARERMASALAAAGFTRARSVPDGARLLRIETEAGGTVGPYIDGDAADIYGDRDDDAYAYFGDVPDGHRRGAYLGRSDASHSCGGLFAPLEDEGEECASCGERFDEDDMTGTTDGLACESCLDAHYVVTRDRFRGRVWMRSDDTLEAADGEHFTDERAARACGYDQVSDSGDWYHLDDLTRDEITDDLIHDDDAVCAWTPDGREVTTHCSNATTVFGESFTDDDDHARAVHLSGGGRSLTSARRWFLPDEQPRGFSGEAARWLVCRSTLRFRVPVVVHSRDVRDVAFGRDEAGAFWITWTDTSGDELLSGRDSIPASVVHDIHAGDDIDEAGALILDGLDETTAPLPIPDGLGAPVALAA